MDSVCLSELLARNLTVFRPYTFTSPTKANPSTFFYILHGVRDRGNPVNTKIFGYLKSSEIMNPNDRTSKKIRWIEEMWP
jgi:hypothetical protein